MNNLIKVTSMTQTNPVLATKQTESSQTKFSTIFKEALEQVSEAENTADTYTRALATGKQVDLHDVMIHAQKAKITVETAVQMQQKVIDIYSEVMRMQV